MSLLKSRSKVASGKCPAFRASSSSRQSEKLTAGRSSFSTAGALTNTGTIQMFGVGDSLSAASLTNTGSLLGAGTINSLSNGTFNNSGGNFEPASAPDVPGTLSINGNYKQGAGGTLTIDLGGIAAGQFSVLEVSGNAALDGTVDLTALNSFTPQLVDDFTFLPFGTESGNFASMDFTNWTCPEGDTCTDVFGPNSLTLEITGPSGSPTPEPSAWLMLGTALPAMAARTMMPHRRAQ
ncbi:MAG: hypothetical protein ACLQOO_12995 [Terriglobia bacterium]